MTASSDTVDDSRPAGPLGRLWLRLKSHWTPAPIATVDALKSFVEQRSALIAQKCAIDYVRGKTGQASHALFAEKTFLDALEVCRWETFAVVFGDLLILVENHLRPHAAAADRARLCDALVGLYTGVLSAFPVPEHRVDGWGDVIASSALRLRSASVAEPKHIVDVADHSAKRLFDTLPIHTRYRELDEEPVYGSVRFRMVAVNQELQRRFRSGDLVRALLQSPPRPGVP